MNRTEIAWTDRSWNPVRGCSRVSEGCRNCYAERMAARFSDPGMWGHGFARRGVVAISTSGNVGERYTRWTGRVELVPDKLDEPLRLRKPQRIFVNSTSDLFHEALSDEAIDRVFAVMALAPQHTFQVLTKRPERMRSYVCSEATPGRVARAADAMLVAMACADLVEERQEIAGFPGYFVTNTGRVLSGKRGEPRELKPDAAEQGYLRVPLFRDGGPPRGERHLVHRLVLEAFVGPAPDTEAQGCHQDGNPSNNAVPNLRWGDQSSNWSDRLRHGRARSYSKLNPGEADDIRHRIALGHPAERVARDFGISGTQARNIARGDQWSRSGTIAWPLASVWLGVSVERQKEADERIPLLLETPAAVRFVSYEPALGPVDCRPSWLAGYDYRGGLKYAAPRLDLVIAGGESGPGARPFALWWARNVRDQCREAGVSFFMKQVGSRAADPSCASVDCTHPDCSPGWLKLKHPKGGDPAEWPEDLRVRELPA